MGATLPAWVWVQYYFIYGVVFCVSLYIVRKRGVGLPYARMNLLLVPLVMVLNFFYALQRVDVNEFVYFWGQLQDFRLFAMVLLVLNVYVYGYYFYVFYRFYWYRSVVD